MNMMQRVAEAKKNNLVLSLGEKICLRPLVADDVGQPYVDGLNDSRVNEFLSGPQQSVQTLSTVRAFVQSNWDATTSILFGVFESGRHCGNVRLHDITNGSAWLGIALFATCNWNKGVGSRSIRTVSTFAASDDGTVNAGIDPKNWRSIRAFQRAGYRPIENTADSSLPSFAEHWVFP